MVCMAFFNDIVKSDVIDNNMCKIFNGVMVEAIIKPVIAMLKEIRRYVMQRIVFKKKYIIKWNFDVGQNIVVKLDKERNKCAKW